MESAIGASLFTNPFQDRDRVLNIPYIEAVNIQGRVINVGRHLPRGGERLVVSINNTTAAGIDSSIIGESK